MINKHPPVNTRLAMEIHGFSLGTDPESDLNFLRLFKGCYNGIQSTTCERNRAHTCKHVIKIVIIVINLKLRTVYCCEFPPITVLPLNNDS